MVRSLKLRQMVRMGVILFNPADFNEAGTFTYTIVEQKPATPESAITYDESVHTLAQ